MSRRKKSLNKELHEILSPGFVFDVAKQQMLLFKNNKWIDLSEHGLMKSLLPTLLYLNRWDQETKSGFWYI